MIDHGNDAPVPTAADAPESFEWFRARLEGFMQRCDATVAQILKQEAATNLSEEFALPSTDELIGLPPSSRGTNAYAQATKNLKERLTREVRLMEAAIEKGFKSLAGTEKALLRSRREVRDLRSVLVQLGPGAAAEANASTAGQAATATAGVLASSPSMSSGAFVSSSSLSAFPADIAVSLAEEQSELKQLRMTLNNLQAQVSATKKELVRERTAFKDTCDGAVKLNTVGGPQSLRS